MLFFGASIYAQNDSTTKVDVFLSKSIVKQTELKGVKLLNDIAVSSSQNLLLASNNCLYCIGYGDYVARKVTGKRIITFCVLDNDVYFVSDKAYLFKIDTNNVESRIMKLQFTPQKTWSGYQMIYACAKQGKTSKLYAIFPARKAVYELYSSTASIVGVDEYGPIVFILTSRCIVVANMKDKVTTEIPIGTDKYGELKSLAIDKKTGGIYISTSKGIYRAFEGQFQKV